MVSARHHDRCLDEGFFRPGCDRARSDALRVMDPVWTPLLLSLKVAGCATALATLLGVAIAYGLSRVPGRSADLVDAILSLPLVLPPTVMGYYLLVVFGRRGMVGQWLDAWGITLVFTWQGAVLAAAVVAFPLVLRSARTAFLGIDPELERAGRALGVSETVVFWRIALPLAWPGILAGVLLAFARALGEFGATLMLAGSLPGKTQTLSIAIFEAVQAGDDSTAGALVATTSVVCIAALVLAGRLAPSRRRADQR